jgi:hypothetical protein
VAVGEADRVLEPLRVELGVAAGVPVPVALGVGEGVPVGKGDAVGLPDSDMVPVAEAEAPGLRLLLAQFTASSGDKRLLSPAMRIELEAVAQRLARVHCHVLT